jgi:hypothetical protein
MILDFTSVNTASGIVRITFRALQNVWKEDCVMLTTFSEKFVAYTVRRLKKSAVFVHGVLGPGRDVHPKNIQISSKERRHVMAIEGPLRNRF